MFQEDWIMRQIESIVDFLIVAVLKKEKPGYELTFQQEGSADADLLHEELLRLIRERKINEAENLLFERLDTGDDQYLELAVDFYSRLNKLDDETLENSDFSRGEIQDGLKEIAGRFGISLSGLFQSMQEKESDA